MIIHVLTLFPGMFPPVLSESMLGKANEKGILELDIIDIRDFTLNKHKKTDDTPFGGGAGMVMNADPIFRALENIHVQGKRILYMSPRGKLLDQSMIEELAELDELTILCGHYEGVDQRVLDHWNMEEVSIGDYILNTKLSDTPAAENAYLYNLDGTKQAMSVTIKSFATGLSGKLKSGDIVSVLVADYQETGKTVTPPELQYVEIISVTASTGYDANTGEATAEDEKELPSTVTVLVRPEQAQVLAGLEPDAKIHLTLVYRGTQDNAQKFIDTQDALIEQLYPDPEATEETPEREAADPADAATPESEAATDDEL